MEGGIAAPLSARSFHTQRGRHREALAIHHLRRSAPALCPLYRTTLAPRPESVKSFSVCQRMRGSSESPYFHRHHGPGSRGPGPWLGVKDTRATTSNREIEKEEAATQNQNHHRVAYV